MARAWRARVKEAGKEERLEILAKLSYAGLIIHAKEFGLCPGGHGSQKGVLTGKQYDQFGVQGIEVLSFL